ncbi:hypothetical protein BDA99DRAFT_539086 [Phascolomyces articulosus]|uniref:Uncharacterized protein n=1 Tax=Phascolomyces articulosus TaxID=60185 RepID=A0AAD5JWL7_9FUNG|nr:hypothetical protein BDA99DRAFT_539086 [Phascolomyces articulosus]
MTDKQQPQGPISNFTGSGNEYATNNDSSLLPAPTNDTVVIMPAIIQYDHPEYQNATDSCNNTIDQRILSNNHIDAMGSRYKRLVDQEKIYQREHCRRAKYYRKMRIQYLLKLQGTHPLPVDLKPYLHRDPWCFNDTDDVNDDKNVHLPSKEEEGFGQQHTAGHILCPLHENNMDLDPNSNLDEINERIMQEYQYNNEHLRQRAEHYKRIYQRHLDIIF